MTSLLDRFTAANPGPETTMTHSTQGLPPVPGGAMIPWWTGVPGLDPDVRTYADWVYAAECAAIACGIHVLGADAGRADWLRLQVKGPVRKWAEWLAGGGQALAPKRILALRMLCERADAIHPDHILSVAQAVCSAGTLR